MGIEDIKRWHWIVMGVVVGAILTYTRMQILPDETSVLRRGISAFDFIRDLQRPKTPNGYAWLRDVTIYPPVENKTYVTGQQLEIHANGKGVYKPFQLIADIPFKFVGGAPAPRQNYSIRDYVDQIARNRSDVKYRFAWWSLPWAIAAIWGGGAVVVIGGVWPTIVNLMIGAGLGRKREEAPEYDLDRFKGGPESAAAARSKVPTADDHQKLRELEQALQRKLAAGADQPSTVMMNPSADAPVRKLEAGQLELTAAQQKQEEAQEYEGEYYPVAHPPVHKEESKP